MKWMELFDINNDFAPFGGFNFIEKIEKGEELSKDNGKKKIVIKLDGEIPLIDLSVSWNPPQNKKTGTLGGGAQINASKEKSAIDPKIREALEKLAQGRIFQKERGNLELDGRQLIKKIINYQFGSIEEAKHSWKPKKVYFFVDTSGSVWYLANIIIKLIKSTCTSKTIRVFSGSEGHPNKDENNNKVFKEYRDTLLHDGLETLFAIERPDHGSVFVFWGDLQGAGIEPIKLKQTLKNYKVFWFNPSNTIVQTCETGKMRKVCPVFMGMNTTNKIINQLKKII